MKSNWYYFGMGIIYLPTWLLITLISYPIAFLIHLGKEAEEVGRLSKK